MYLYNSLTCSRSFRMKVMIPSTMITLAPYMHCCTHTHTYTSRDKYHITIHYTKYTNHIRKLSMCAVISSHVMWCVHLLYIHLLYMEYYCCNVTVLWCYDTNHATHYLRTRTEMKHTHINDHTRTVY